MYISELSLTKTAEALKNNKLVLEDFLVEICDRMDKVEPHVKAFLPEKNRRKRLLKDAKKLKKKFPNPENRPALYGIPVGIKDLISIDKFKTKAGSKLPAKLFKRKEAEVVRKLKKAGALILGKTVTTEFAYFEPGKTRNPHNIAHTPGGSSSGSAAAVASGFTPLSLGTQTIGSITRPAAFCGIVGFKPSYNRIAKHNIVPFSKSADHVGIFTQTIDSVELAASILCNDWDLNSKISDKKPIFGVIEGEYIKQADDEINSAFQNYLKQLENSGFEIIRTKLFDDIEEINKEHKKMTAAEFALIHGKWFEQHEELYRKKTAELILEGKNITIGELSKAKNGQKLFRKKIEKFKTMNNIDLWLSPATTTAAPKGMATGSPLMNLPWTYAGLPTITFPISKSVDNLPIGVQVSGSFYEDEELLLFTKLLNQKTII